MSDEDQNRPDSPDVSQQLESTDLRRQGNDRCYVSPEAEARARSTVMGETDFEDRDLENMIALVESAKHTDLTTAAQDLWDAAGKIKEVGKELKKHVDNVDWEGEFGDNFRKWGTDLGNNTVVLGDYTEQASTQLMAAGTGLSEVWNAMPKHADPTVPRPEAVPMPSRVDGNAAYEAAKKKEQDRQEAISQMNRLTSYYRVSHDNMTTAPEPKFGPMPNIGMPPAPPPQAPKDGLEGGSPTGGSVQGGTPTGPTGGGAPLSSMAQVAPQEHVGTDINRVATPPVAPPADSGPRVITPTPNPGPTSPNMPGPVGPTPFPNSRPPVGTPKPTGNPGPARGMPPGRFPGPTTTGPISGGTPNQTGRTGTPPMGRSNPITGGTPRSTGPTTSGPRIPRGNVVGTEHGPMGRPPMGMGGMGGSGGLAGTGGTAGRRLASTPGGIVGNPRYTSAQGATARPFTPGGTGLVPRGGGIGRPGERERNDSQRPDYLTEDEETWATGRNGMVPPVVE